MTVLDVMTASKDQLPEAAMEMDASELPKLVSLLCEKNDSVRYQAFLAVQYRSQRMDDVYPFWDTFQSKLASDNSYQRSIGMMLIAENVRWDKADRITGAIDAYLDRLNDEKPITVRQCIQSLLTIHPYKPQLDGMIAARLMSIDLMSMKETMRKLILMDILQVLITIRKSNPSVETDQYIMNALSGGILDAKAIKQIKALL
jgi:hypothetical protein